MISVKFTVNGQKLKRITTPFLVTDSKNYVLLEFKFSDDWNGCKKTAIFNDEYKKELVGDCVIVPASCVTASEFTVSVYGELEEMLITTNSVNIQLGDSGYKDDAEPTPEAIIEELKAELEEMKKGNEIFKWIGENLIDEGKPKGAVFCNNKEITVIPEMFNFSLIEDAPYLFYNCINLKEIKPVFDFSQVSDASEWMTGCEALEEIRFVPDTIGASEMLGEVSIPSPILSTESIHSILMGYVFGATVLMCFHSDVVANFTAEHWEIIGNKNVNFM